MSLQLTKKEKDFCTAFALTGDLRSAAAKAGYLFPEKSGAKLLTKASVRKQIELLKKTFFESCEAHLGLKKIAFGSVSDAINLALALNGGEAVNPEKLDLFMVSEIKLPKNGGIEIKFFDRIKALSILAEKDQGGFKTSPSDFISAMEQGAKTLNETFWSLDNEN